MTSTPIRLGIVGLGAMGQALFTAALPHPDFVVTRAADLDSATIARLAAEHLGIMFSTEPKDVIGADGVDAVYINWRELFVAEGNGWQPVDLTGEPGSETTRLSLFARAIRGEQSPDLANFASAFRVQQVVEAFHRPAED